jgi:hypothetical protein
VPRYEVYATRFDNPHIVEELIPARDLEFSLPLNDHGEASFSATVEPGRSMWRPAIALPMSGILITRDSVPVWSGWVTDEDPAGPRSFTFHAREWGFFFEEKTPAFTSDRTINSWDDTTAGREFRSLADALGGPEWYFGTAGTIDNPVRQLVLGDRLGHTTAQTTLEFVEDTVPFDAPSPPPVVALLGDLFPGDAPLVPTRRLGGNLIAQGRSRSVSNAATVVNAVGAGTGAARKETLSEASGLLNAGWPRMTTVTAHTDVDTYGELQAFSDADLRKYGGIATGYQLVALDGDPDWTQTPRGSVVRVILDTDIYGAGRPVGGPNGFDARLRNTIVRVPARGNAQVEWQVNDVLEVQ